MKFYLLPICTIFACSLLAEPSLAKIQIADADSSSNQEQQIMDEEDLSPKQKKKKEEDGNYDKADGGLYCPDNDCSSDPEDAAQGF